MAVWIAKIECLAAILPRFPEFNRNAVISKPLFPSSQLGACDAEGNVDRSRGISVPRLGIVVLIFRASDSIAAMILRHPVPGRASKQHINVEGSATALAGTSMSV